MDVHPVLRGINEASQLQLPRAEPHEQPIESSQEEISTLEIDIEIRTPLNVLSSHEVKALFSLAGSFV